MESKNKFWIGTSWKMNKIRAEAMHFARQLTCSDALQATSAQIFVIPPFTAIEPVHQELAKTSVLVGAQNIHWEDAGAWTGEISADMVRDCGAKIAEIGHSERRQHFNESDASVSRKVRTAIESGLIPLICVGETQEQKEKGIADDVLTRQVAAALAGLDSQRDDALLLAYEPVWAIGETGTPATPGYANERHKIIKQVAMDTLGRDIPCLYGGSVNLSNCEELARCSHINGLFIGRAAWDIQGFLAIINRCQPLL